MMYFIKVICASSKEAVVLNVLLMHEEESIFVNKKEAAGSDKYKQFIRKSAYSTSFYKWKIM